jgi:hypothetical protein
MEVNLAGLVSSRYDEIVTVNVANSDCNASKSEEEER